jgi:hypothetical protein
MSFSSYKLQSLVLLVSSFILFSCGNPVKILKKEIRKKGYILYQTPIAHAGTGTLVGGPPSGMMLVSHPQTCFPDLPELGYQIRRIDNVNLPNIARKITVSGNLNVELLNVLGAGAAPIGVGAGIDNVQEIELTFEDAQVEYLDSVLLKTYHDQVMDQVCKDFLDQVGFVVQALKVGKMKFEFKRRNGARIELTTPVLEDIVSIGVGVDYEIENRYTLVINTPKYLGYQLGQLRKKDGGYAFYRANKIKRDKYVFKSINVFQSDSRRKRMATRFAPMLLHGRDLDKASMKNHAIYMD